MKIVIRLGAVAALFLAVSTNAQEPSWNDAQSEVWALVEQSWVDDVAENGKWPADYILDKYVAWGDGNAAPRYKDATIAWSRFGASGMMEPLLCAWSGMARQNSISVAIVARVSVVMVGLPLSVWSPAPGSLAIRNPEASHDSCPGRPVKSSH